MRRGFTVVELLVTMAILMIALTLVVVDFRKVNEREYLKQAALDTVVALQDYQSRALGNQQSPGMPGTNSTVAYGFRVTRTASGIGFGAFSNDASFVPTCGANPVSFVDGAQTDVTFSANVSVRRIDVLPPAVGGTDASPVLVAMDLGTGKPRVSVAPTGNCFTAPVSAPLTITLLNSRITQCWAVKVFPNGLITQNSVACP